MGANAILSGLDLDVVDGEFLVLLGPSGCGKSTLLHAIAGLIDVESGSVSIGGRDVTWADPKDRGIGMVFQSYALYPTMNVEKNIVLRHENQACQGKSRNRDSAWFAASPTGCELDSLLDRASQSAAFGRTAATRRALLARSCGAPQVFLMDEPLSNLDAKLRTELRRELKALHRDLGATMIYVTHDQVEAMTLATRVAVMRGGRIQQIGTPGEVYARPANMFVAGFLGSPSMNFLDGDVGGTAATLGIRPEHLQLHPAGGVHPEAEVTLVEAMGAHEVVWLDMAGHKLAAIAPAADVHRLGDRVGVQMALDRASLFDPVSQERIDRDATGFRPRGR